MKADAETSFKFHKHFSRITHQFGLIVVGEVLKRRKCIDRFIPQTCFYTPTVKAAYYVSCSVATSGGCRHFYSSKGGSQWTWNNWLLFEFGVKVDVDVTFITIIMSYSNVTEAT